MCSSKFTVVFIYGVFYVIIITGVYNDVSNVVCMCVLITIRWLVKQQQLTNNGQTKWYIFMLYTCTSSKFQTDNEMRGKTTCTSNSDKIYCINKPNCIIAR